MLQIQSPTNYNTGLFTASIRCSILQFSLLFITNNKTYKLTAAANPNEELSHYKLLIQPHSTNLHFTMTAADLI